MRRSMLFFLAAVLMHCGCSDSPPTSAPTQWTAVSGSEFALMQSRQGLQSEGNSSFTGYSTQTFPAVAAPIDVMRYECPEKVLSADEVKAFGLEAPYDTNLAVQSSDGVWEAPLGVAAPDADAKYKGDFVVLRKGDRYLSVYPGKSAGKLLRPVSMTVSVEPFASPTFHARRAFGSRMRGRVSQPLLLDDDTRTIKADLEDVWLANPCGK